MPPIDAYPKPLIKIIHDISSNDESILSKAIEVSLEEYIEEIFVKVLQGLYPKPEKIKKKFEQVILEIKPINGVAQCSKNKITLSSKYILQIFNKSGLKGVSFEITGVLIHEMVHIVQNDGKNHEGKTINDGLAEGIADYIRLRANYSPEHWSEKKGKEWDAGYEKTAYFLRWIEDGTLCIKDFVVNLNDKIFEIGWDDEIFKHLTGVEVKELWKMYQNSINSDDEEESDDDNTECDLDFTDCDNYDENFSNINELHFKPQYIFKNKNLNHKGSDLFNSVISNPVEFFKNCSEKSLFVLYSSKPKKSYPYFIKRISLTLKEMNGVAYCTGTKRRKDINLSLNYVENVFNKNGNCLKKLKSEIEGVFVHELTHAWQWSEKVDKNGNGEGIGVAPGGLIEVWLINKLKKLKSFKIQGIADYVRLQAGLNPPHWKRVKNGEWDAGYDKTAYFLQWIEVKKNITNFTRKLNLLIGNQGYYNSHFVSLTGQSVENLWEEYCNEGKVHGSLARAGKVKGQMPKVEKQEKKKKKTGRCLKRIKYNRRFVNAVAGFGKRKMNSNEKK
ncbi:hypothetical protein HK099_004002 [Clydaea vesicula]|uniref:Uncharacterized protein n=1 Tax=Clydaea vesicula TaxID=447962 RepID=A0AAD5U1A4_9FUNG|nr:hypothetical protein HK099_004002 [Clydaea vesicula]